MFQEDAEEEKAKCACVCLFPVFYLQYLDISYQSEKNPHHKRSKASPGKIAESSKKCVARKNLKIQTSSTVKFKPYFVWALSLRFLFCSRLLMNYDQIYVLGFSLDGAYNKGTLTHADVKHKGRVNVLLIRFVKNARFGEKCLFLEICVNNLE